MDRAHITRRLLEFIGWLGVAGVGSVMLTQAVGWNGTRLVAMLQSLTPYGVLVVLVVAAVGAWQRREALAAAGALVGVGAFLLSTPLVIPPAQPAPATGGSDITVASVNVLFSNPIIEAVADELMELDPDVIVFSEFTFLHQRALSAHPLADRYANQIDRNDVLARGMAIWSKFELEEGSPPPSDSRTVDAELNGPDGPIRLLAVHPSTPVYDFPAWERELGRIADVASQTDRPILVIGDFNATYWHPVFRDVLDRGLTDAHMAQGSGWSTSWPTDEFFPPFVRLDHALTGHGLVSTDVEDFGVPGSDHDGLMVTVTLAG